MTGAACIARRRTSRHDMPSLTQRRHAHQDRGRDLDRLQDHAVGDAGAQADVPAGVQHGGAGGLEDTEVGRRRRQHGGDVDREQDRRGSREAAPGRRGRARPAGRSRTSHCSAHAASWNNAALGAEAWLAEHREPGAHAGHRARGPGPAPRAARPRRESAEPWRSTIGASSTTTSSASGRDRRDQQRVLMAAEDVDGREHHRAEHRQREDVQQRLRDDRAQHDRQVLARPAGPPRDDQRARRLTEAGRQRR